MKWVKCQKDGKECMVNRAAKSCRHGDWSGRCPSRIETTEVKPEEKKEAKPSPKPGFSPLGSNFTMSEDGETILCSVCEKPVGKRIGNSISLTANVMGNRAICSKCYEEMKL